MIALIHVYSPNSCDTKDRGMDPEEQMMVGLQWMRTRQCTMALGSVWRSWRRTWVMYALVCAAMVRR